LFNEEAQSVVDPSEPDVRETHSPSGSNRRESLSSEPIKDNPVSSGGGDGNPEADLKVSQWQKDIENSSDQEDWSAILFESCIEVFPLVFHIICEKPENVESSFRDDLREEFRKFYVWNDTFATASGELGSILSTSRNLKEAVYSIMLQWARALCKGNSILFITDSRNKNQS
jgi:hypothetical protein